MTDLRLSRRTFGRALVLGGGLAAFGGATALSSLARAIPRTDQHFVFCYFNGGWDVLLGLDPRDPRDFDEESVSETRIQPGFERLQNIADPDLVRAGPHVFGPYIGELREHAERLCVVRGMSMDTLAHEVGRRRFLTGKPPAGQLARGTNTSAYLAHAVGREDPIPNLSVRVEQYNRDLPIDVTALSVDAISDLVRVLRRGAVQLAPEQESLLEAFHAAQARCARTRRSPLRSRAEGARVSTSELLALELDRQFDFDAPGPENEALRAHFGITGVGVTSPESQAAFAARALTTGITHVVSIQATSGLDTHFTNWETDQGPVQRRGFDAVARLASHLASLEYRDSGDSWLDHTTILGFSEFSRTPLLNEQRGRDHHLTNSCFLLGGLARAGASVGASSDVGMQPQAVHLDTGALDRGGSVVLPEHILRGLMVAAGIPDDTADLRVPPLAAAFRAP
ncbi:MAG: DUF1501 domain-containing protein [Deltaproteobacteria bacterium]|jgi:uncharacterized protein (DUF1501 family)